MSAGRAVRRVVIGGIPIAALSLEEWAELMVADCAANRDGSAPAKFMTSANGYVMSLYNRDLRFKRLIDQADGIDADGMPLVLGSRLLARFPLPERIATADFFHFAAKRADENGISFYFLGSTEEDNRDAVRQVRASYPNLRIAGRHHGFISPDDEDGIVQQIVAAGTDVLWVAMGVPGEHQFIVRNRDKLRGVTWVKSCGGMFKFISGKDPRAPQWMQALCLEWAYRLWREPRRLFWRYFRTNGHAAYLMFKYRALTRDSDRTGGGPKPTTAYSAG